MNLKTALVNDFNQLGEKSLTLQKSLIFLFLVKITNNLEFEVFF
jgi:hypothetical protein